MSFKYLDPEKRKLMASLGGQAAQEKGTAHKWTSEEARQASLKAWKNRRDRANKDE